MKFKKDDLLIYAITDRKNLNISDFCEQVELALSSGIDILQLREKELDEESFISLAKKIKSLCDKYKVPLIINDNVNVALKADASGVHLGNTDMDILMARKILGKDKIIGASARTVELAKDLEEKGADYLGVGDVFGTKTKKDAKLIGVEVLKEISENTNLEVFAIGGINTENIKELKGINIAGVALISAIFLAKDIKAELKKIKDVLKSIT